MGIPNKYLPTPCCLSTQGLANKVFQLFGKKLKESKLPSPTLHVELDTKVKYLFFDIFSIRSISIVENRRMTKTKDESYFENKILCSSLNETKLFVER